MQSLVVAVGALRAPIVAVLVFAVVILLPGQSHEIFAALREARGSVLVGELCRVSLFVLLLTGVLAGACTLLLRHCSADRAQAVAAHRGVLSVLAVGCVLGPLLVLAIVNIDTRITVAAGSASVIIPRRIMGYPLDTLLQIGVLVVYVLGLAGLYVLRFRDISQPVVEGGIASGWIGRLERIGMIRGSIVIAGLILLMAAAVVVAPVWLSRVFGPVGIIFLFFTVLTATGSLLTSVYDRKGIPVLTLLAIGAVVFASTGINNNHGLRRLGVEASASADAPAGFARWLEARPDLARYKSGTYPVYVVAAEGGGLYAAAHAASVLAHVQDTCPAFAHHLFAISGVSGGSLGAAVFASLLKAEPPPKPPTQGAACAIDATKPRALASSVSAYFEHDLLTPLLAAGLFPDFLQRFLPFRVSAFDRARGLEVAFEEAWRSVMTAEGRANHGGTFSGSVRQMWSPQGSVPALLMNATSVHDGDRIVTAPFPLKDETGFIDQRIDLLNRNATLRVSTAVAASARFPLVTPVGWRKEGGVKHMLVDGGYYENSGIATAFHLIDGIKRKAVGLTPQASANDCAAGNTATVLAGKAGAVNVCFRLIVIKVPPSSEDFRLHGELKAPLMALYNVRYGHSRASSRRALNAYCGGRLCGFGGAADRAHIYYRYLSAIGVPLGWYFSSETMRRITVAPEPETRCIQAANASTGGVGDELAVENACLTKRVRDDLR